ncbi:MAG: FAD-dependent oxidoreductase [Planctomycetota bacterium]|nr:FAD-dependent oxidoreductase [Planctomycetota bacterium]
MPLEYHPPYDLMLCGGGVVGLSIAYECASNGWKVLLVDSGQIGKESSWAGAGILPAGATTAAQDPTEQLRALSHRLHPEWSQRLLEQTGIDNEFRRCGGLYLGMSPAERATLAANQMWWDEHGVGFESWSAHELAIRLPFMREQAAVNERLRAWYVPEDCQVRNPRHIRALVAACKKLGVTMLENACVDSFETHADRIVSAHSGVRVFHAEKFCVTSGAWASQLLKPIGIETGILPVRGQMVLYKLDKPLFSMVINEGHRYLVPRDDGYVLAGSCEEEVGFDHRTTAEMIDPIKEWALQICPVLSQAVVERVWSGLRPGSFDTLPYLGTLHPFENGFVAAGHFRHGLHWSTATGLLMYQWMSGQKTEIDLMPFRVQRGQTLGMQLHTTNHSNS